MPETPFLTAALCLGMAAAGLAVLPVARAESPVPAAEVYGPALLPDHTPLVSTAGPATAFVLAMDRYGQVLQGSGVVVGEDGWVATSYDLVAWTDTFEVQLDSGDGAMHIHAAQLARVYPELGVALLHVPGVRLPALPAAEPHTLVPGARVVSLGYPTYNQLERGLRLSRGSLTTPGATPEDGFLRADLLYVSGLAGAAVCTPDGALVGMIVGPEPASATTVRILPTAELAARAQQAAAQLVPLPEAP